MKVLYVDFDGTLCTDRYWRSLPFDIHTKLQSLLFGQDRTVAHDWMRGLYTAEEVNEFVAKTLNISYQELWSVFVADCTSMFVAPELLESIQTLRTRYITVMMTGNMDSFTRFTVPALKLNTYFDYISNSYYEKLHKTDNNGELFKRYAEKLNIPTNVSILIDDHIKCCDTFSNLGGTAHLVSSPTDTLKILKESIK